MTDADNVVNPQSLWQRFDGKHPNLV